METSAASWGTRRANAPGDPTEAAGEDETGTLSLEGRVIWSDGRPAEAARVSILSRPAAGRSRFAADRETMSDDKGQFAFDLQAPGAFLVRAQLDDAVSPAIRVKLGETTAPITLVLLPGASLVITVVSAESDRPIPGARVRVLESNDQVAQGDGFSEERTDDAGRASFRGLDPVGNHLVWAEADGFAGQQINVMPMQHATTNWEARIALSPGAFVSGRVLDSRGAGVAGALVAWSNTEGVLDESGFRVFNPFSDYGRLSEKVTDADGRYRMTVPVGLGCVIAEKPGLRVGTKCRVTASLGHETGGVDVVLLDGLRVAGRVVDASGAPVAGADVLATTPDANHEPSMRRAYRYRTKSGADGRFALSGLPPQAMALAALTETASSPLVDVDLTTRRPPSDVVLQLEYTGTLAGVVKETDGNPVAFAAVNYWLEPDFAALEKANGGRPPKVIREFALPTQNEATITDAEGHFSVGGLLPGRYTIRAARPTAASVPSAYASASRYQVQTGQTVELVLPGLGGVRGQLRTDDGVPVGPFDVSLYLGPDGATAPDYMFPGGHHFSSRDGAFQISGVPEGTYTLRIDGDEVIPIRLAVQVHGTKTTDLGVITVARGIPARTGRVIDEEQRPAAKATISVELPDSAARMQLWSEDDGTFRIPPLKRGTTARLRAEIAGGAASDWATLSPNARDIVLVLATNRYGAVRGILLDSGSVEDRLVMLAHPGDKPPGTGETEMREVTQTLSGGRFSFDNVPPGTYVLWVPLGGKEFARYPEPIEVQHGRELRVVFDVAASPRVTQ